MPALILFGILLITGSGAIGAGLVLQNRGAAAEVQVFGHLLTVHLYTVLIVGALLACWGMLGAAVIGCRISERRRLREARAAAASAERVHHHHRRPISVDRPLVGRHAAPLPRDHYRDRDRGPLTPVE